jgi:citrate synthase
MALVLRRNPKARPEPRREHFEDVVRMLGYEERPHFAQALRRYWICVAEHGMNASTFTARVVASTRASYQASVGAALGALEGPLHGGAPGPVLDMLQELRQCSEPERWLWNELDQGRRLMGFGHRIYRQRDPRADFLQKACLGLPELAEELNFAASMERLVAQVLARHRPGRPLRTNVEYYTALLLSHLGFKKDEFTAVFACGRALGWVAHIFEQQAENKLIRPEVTYVGALAAKG